MVSRILGCPLLKIPPHMFKFILEILHLVLDHCNKTNIKIKQVIQTF